MSAEIAAELLRNGVLGIALVVVGYVVIVLWKDNKADRKEKEAIQSQRVADAQAVTERMLKIAEFAVSSVNSSTAAIAAYTEALKGVRESLDGLSENVRDRLPIRR